MKAKMFIAFTLWMAVMIACADDQHDIEIIMTLPEPMPYILDSLFNAEQIPRIKAMAKDEAERSVRGRYIQWEQLSDIDAYIADQIKQGRDDYDWANREIAERVIARRRRDILGYIEHFRRRAPMQYDRAIWNAIQSAVKEMDVAGRADFTLRCIRLVRETEEHGLQRKLRELLLQRDMNGIPGLPLQGRWLAFAFAADYPEVRQYLFDEMTQKEFNYRARSYFMRYVDKLHEDEIKNMIELIRRGNYELMDIAIKFRIDGALGELVRHLVENDAERLAAAPEIAIGMYHHISREDVPTVLREAEDGKTHQVPLIILPGSSVRVKALDLAHTYLAVFGDERSIEWLRTRYDELKQPGWEQPTEAHNYFLFLFMVRRAPQDQMIREKLYQTRPTIYDPEKWGR